MSNSVLNEYLKYVLIQETHVKSDTKKPFITINAEYGCLVEPVIEELKNELVSRYAEDWLVLDREILIKAAEELKVREKEIVDSLEESERSIVSDFLDSFSQNFYGPKTKQIVETVSAIVRNHAQKGNVILVGRASDMITSHLKEGLHVSLEAPIIWRVNQLMNAKKITEEEAWTKIELDEERKAYFRKQFENQCSQPIAFCLRINQSVTEPEESARIILRMLDKA